LINAVNALNVNNLQNVYHTEVGLGFHILLVMSITVIIIIRRIGIYTIDDYKLGMLMYRCQHNKAPRYLMDHCTSVSDVACHQRLRSASSHEVSVPRHRLSTYGRRAFAVVDPTVWNSLPEDMRDPAVSDDSYRQSLKMFLFVQY